mmetsp:Transcript_16031/g.50256  ORF Transcript_16031/g.50256 Transcript_16031/m.50256 type:complete len:229 (-) Transcript_16031:148-834(-)
MASRFVAWLERVCSSCCCRPKLGQEKVLESGIGWGTKAKLLEEESPKLIDAREERSEICSQEMLLEAAEKGDREEVRRHVESGFDVDVFEEEDGYTPLLLAAECGHLNIVDELLRAGAKTDAKDAYGRTALYAAAVAGHKDVCRCLLRHGANPDARDDDSRTIFWAVLALRHCDMAQLLLDHAAVDVDAADASGRSPLTYALDCGHADVIDFLKQHGASDDTEGRLSL